MASITIRNLDDGVKKRLRIRAEKKGTSIEEEARDALRATLEQEITTTEELYHAIRADVEAIGGVDIEPLARQPFREPPFNGPEWAEPDAE